MSQASEWGVFRTADAPKTPDEVKERDGEMLDAQLSSHSGAARPSYAVAGTVWHNSTEGRWYLFDGTNDVPIPHLVSAAPASDADAGITGDYFVDASFRYDCIATDTWVHVAVVSSF